MFKTKTLTVALATALPLFCATAQAAWTPEKPVEFVVTSGAGGGTDTFARTIQSIIIKNKLMNVSHCILTIK